MIRKNLKNWTNSYLLYSKKNFFIYFCVLGNGHWPAGLLDDTKEAISGIIKTDNKSNAHINLGNINEFTLRFIKDSKKYNMPNYL